VAILELVASGGDPPPAPLTSRRAPPARPPLASPCLDENEVLAFVEGEVDAAARQRGEVHLEACVTCRRVVSVLAREFGPAPAAPEAANEAHGRAKV
jgi:hypothetical protein